MMPKGLGHARHWVVVLAPENSLLPAAWRGVRHLGTTGPQEHAAQAPVRDPGPDVGGADGEGATVGAIEVGAGFHPDLTGRDNIYLNGTILGMTRAEIGASSSDRRFSELADFLTRRSALLVGDVRPARVRGGGARRADVLWSTRCCRWATSCPAQERREMRQVMKGGTTVVFVSHNCGGRRPVQARHAARPRQRSPRSGKRPR